MVDPMTAGTPVRPRISAVVACYKDALAIPSMHARLSAVFAELDVDYELIFVNDGSPDDTDTVLQDLSKNDDHVLAIEHARNFGSQNAFLSGMQAATGDAVVLLDGDLQDPPEVIPAFYQAWRDGNEVVYGRRKTRDGSPMLSLAYRMFYRIFRRVSEVPMPLDAGDFSLMDRKVVDALLAFPESDQFLRGLRAWVGFKQVGVDYHRPERAFGRSNQNLRRNFWWAKKGIFSFSSLPVEWLGYAGGILTVVSILAVLGLLVDMALRPGVSHGVAAIVVLILFFGSVNLLAVAVLGEYLIKVVAETKRRPKFIRRAIRHRGARIENAKAMEHFLGERHESARRTDGRATD